MSAATDPGGGRAGVTYCVRDNGLGIPRDFQPKIFQPFQRLHPGQAQGEGIGLMLVRQMVERHGGRIWFESEADAGAAFFVTLPACAVEPAAALPAASPPAAVSLQESST